MKNLTPYNEQNKREVEMMVGKAMCAYANYTENQNNRADLIFNHGIKAFELTQAALESELEATERCIAMFVEEHLPEIGIIVIERAKEEFGI